MGQYLHICNFKPLPRLSSLSSITFFGFFSSRNTLDNSSRNTTEPAQRKVELYPFPSLFDHVLTLEDAQNVLRNIGELID